MTKAIEEFLADSSRHSFELPHMTTGQRKNARKLAEQHPEIKCESYGFGQDRQLHLFKRKPASPQATPAHNSTLCATPAFSVKNTFIDDFSGEEPEPIIFRSMPAPLNKQLLEALAADSCSKSVDSPASSDDVSTAGSNGEEVASTSESSSPLSLADWQLPDLADDIQVRNTFIHIEDSSADERVIKSMPHGMFGQCLVQEQLASEEVAQEHKPTGESGFLLAPLVDDIAGSQTLPEQEAQSGFLLAPLQREKKPTFLLAPLLDIDSNYQQFPERVLPPPSSPPTTLSSCSSPSTPPPPYEALLSVRAQSPRVRVLQPGAKVILQGLIKIPTFNGRLAVVESWDAEVGRYSVSVDSQQAMVKPDNLRPMAR